MMYHVAPRAAHEQILSQGLRPTRFRMWPDTDYPSGVYLEPDIDIALDEADARNGTLYEVDTAGCDLLEDPVTKGCFYVAETIPPERLRKIDIWRD